MNRNWLKVLASLLGVLTTWWVITKFGAINTVFFPTPFSVAVAAVEMHQDGVLWSDLRASLTRAATGFAVGGILGIFVGLLTSRTAFFMYSLGPFLTLLRPIPAIALVPIAIIWFGIGEGSKYFVISYTVFLAVWLNTHHGMSMVASTYIRASRSLGATRLREFFEVVMPAAAPHIMAGLRLGATLAFLSLVAAELTGASSGIGYRLQEARQFIRTDRMFVCLIELGLLGALLDYIFVTLGHRVVHWEQL